MVWHLEDPPISYTGKPNPAPTSAISWIWREASAGVMRMASAVKRGSLFSIEFSKRELAARHFEREVLSEQIEKSNLVAIGRK